MKIRLAVYFFLLCILVQPCFGSNLQITNIQAISTSELKIKIAWDNSWRSNEQGDNHDAVWIFVKTKDCTSNTPVWLHGDLGASGHVAGSGLEIMTVPDNKGLFIRRSTEGSGNIAATDVTIKLANTYNLSNVSFEIIGIEMVYVPAGPLYIGGNLNTISNNTSETFTDDRSSFGNSSLSAFSGVTKIANENTTLQTSDFKPHDVGTHTYTTIPQTYPKGTMAMYCMKYELTQGQYCHFLNLLEEAQQNVRIQNQNAAQDKYAFGGGTTPFDRNFIRKMVNIGNGVTTSIWGMEDGTQNPINYALQNGAHVAMNLISFEDLLAYLDWSALRPMTELEYEKLVRGQLPNTGYKYPWGNQNLSLSGSIYSLANAGTPLEYVNSLSANANFSTRPNRVGALAYYPPTIYVPDPFLPRHYTGASPWGILDLLGNVSELCYPIGAVTFTGNLGDGNLNSNGDMNVTNWPIGTDMAMRRGGGYNCSSSLYTVLYRENPIATSLKSATQSTITNDNGGRGVRQVNF